jgi:hypothetical protein
MFHALLRRLPLRKKKSAWAFGGPAGGRRVTGEQQLVTCAAEPSKYYRLYLHSGKVTLDVSTTRSGRWP